MIRRQIFSPALAKAMSVSIKTTVGESSDHVRSNAVMYSPSDLLPTDACANLSCTLACVALLVSMAILGKFLPTSLNLLLSGSLIHMISLIEQIFLLQITL